MNSSRQQNENSAGKWVNRVIHSATAPNAAQYTSIMGYMVSRYRRMRRRKRERARKTHTRASNSIFTARINSTCVTITESKRVVLVCVRVRYISVSVCVAEFMCAARILIVVYIISAQRTIQSRKQKFKCRCLCCNGSIDTSICCKCRLFYLCLAGSCDLDLFASPQFLSTVFMPYDDSTLHRTGALYTI